MSSHIPFRPQCASSSPRLFCFSSRSNASHALVSRSIAQSTAATQYEQEAEAGHPHVGRRVAAGRHQKVPPANQLPTLSCQACCLLTSPFVLPSS
jgi:hypothetical protein